MATNSAFALRVFVAYAIAALALLLVSCSGAKTTGPAFSVSADRSAFSSELDALEVPESVDPALFEELKVLARQRLPGVGAGRFGTDMQVELINDGPVTFWLEVRARSG